MLYIPNTQTRKQRLPRLTFVLHRALWSCSQVSSSVGSPIFTKQGRLRSSSQTCERSSPGQVSAFCGSLVSPFSCRRLTSPGRDSDSSHQSQKIQTGTVLYQHRRSGPGTRYASRTAPPSCGRRGRGLPSSYLSTCRHCNKVLTEYQSQSDYPGL